MVSDDWRDPDELAAENAMYEHDELQARLLHWDREMEDWRRLIDAKAGKR